LNVDGLDDTALEPDLLVVCDFSKIEEYGCQGPPDVVMEILSPSTEKKDRVLKFQAYQKAGVREYWVVDSDTQSVQVHLLENGRYWTTAYTETDDVPVTVLPGLIVHLPTVFTDH
jgi:Uma2 family endonuclease